MQNSLKVAVTLLAVLAVALIVVIFYVSGRKQNEFEKVKADHQQLQSENEAINALLKRSKDDLHARELAEGELKAQIEQITAEKLALAEQLGKVTNELVTAASSLTQASKSVESLKGEKTQMQARINALNGQVAQLDSRINRLEDELVRGESNRELLLKELAGLRIEKSNLDRKFNDITEVRAQYKSLRHDEILENRRRWSAQGYGGFYTRNNSYEPKRRYKSPASQYDMKAEIYFESDTNRAPHQVSDEPGR